MPETIIQNQNPTLAQSAKLMGADGSIMTVVKMLEQNTPIVKHMSYKTCNNKTTHLVTIQAALAKGSFRKLYGFTMPTAGSFRQVRESTAMYEAYLEIDVAVVNLQGKNKKRYLFEQEQALVTGIGQDMEQSFFFANDKKDEEKFYGLAPRFNDGSALNGANIFSGGGTGADNQSIWIIQWGDDACHGLLPEGSVAGLQRNFKGQSTLTKDDGGRMEVIRTHFKWDVGLAVPDWRCVARIANVDMSNLSNNREKAGSADLPTLIHRAIRRMKKMNTRRDRKSVV